MNRERDKPAARKPPFCLFRLASPHAGSGPAVAITFKKYFAKNISLNACVRNVFAVIQSCDSCRIHGHLLHDRAPIAHDATQNIFRMSGAHERHPASTLACANESRYTTIKKSKKRKRLDHNPMELLTMATHALPSSHALSSHIVDADDAPVAPATSPQPSLMRRLFDAFTAAQMRRAQREVDRILGPGSLHRAFRAQLPPER
jgi:hypothetical protein